MMKLELKRDMSGKPDFTQYTAIMNIELCLFG